MNGLEAIGQIRRMYSEAGVDAPVFIMASCLSYQECLAAGAVPAALDRFIAKPFDRHTVLTALAEAGIGQAPARDTGEGFW